MVSVVVGVQVGLQLVGLNNAVAPAGRPDAENVTACVVPETSVAVIVFDPEDACVAVMPPLLESEKSKETALLTVTVIGGDVAWLLEVSVAIAERS